MDKRSSWCLCEEGSCDEVRVCEGGDGEEGGGEERDEDGRGGRE